MSIQKKVRESLAVILKHLDCEYANENDLCVFLEECPKCRYHVSDEEFVKAYDHIRRIVQQKEKYRIERVTLVLNQDEYDSLALTAPRDGSIAEYVRKMIFEGIDHPDDPIKQIPVFINGEKRTRTVCIALTGDEKNRLRVHAQSKGLTLSKAIRNLIFDSRKLHSS